MAVMADDTTSGSGNKLTSQPKSANHCHVAMAIAVKPEYKFIYTDGSKSQRGISYSVVKEDTIIKHSILPEYSSVFTAEIIAIYEAINYTKYLKGKFVIVSDSLSALDCIANPNNNNIYASLIRDIINYEKHLLVWVPGHSNIKGNEFADLVAKEAFNFPLTTTDNLNLQDIKNFVKTQFYCERNSLWNNCSDWYKSISNNKTNIKTYIHNNKLLSRRDQIKIIRLRLGHSSATHDHIINKDIQKECTFCKSTTFDMNHLLSNCQHVKQYIKSLFPNINLIDTLKNLDTTKLVEVINFLKRSNLYNYI
ncbi:uncharacterized protein LOC131802040 [Musca domestica]|uniref:ribonuclease H n=1 Tax=Musca domestica TaxID=7370 RepID=A0ABM3UV21_MUSDO|nr:uncharacterized protein LOC131802040 [Musca domestica]